MQRALRFSPAAHYDGLAMTGGVFVAGLRDEFRAWAEPMCLDAPRYMPFGGCRSHDWHSDSTRYVDAQPVRLIPERW